MKILIVEDEPALLKILDKKIQRVGHQTILASDGEEAVQKVLKEKPDIMLLDIMIPKKNGIEVLKELRTIHKCTLPVIVLSNLDEDEKLRAARHYEVANYFIKSNISLDSLVSAIVHAKESK